MTTNITNDFSYALMIVTAKRIARLAQTDKQAAADYFDMHAASMSVEEREVFGNAVTDAAIKLVQ